ncbi:MAG: TIR domain-containing protein [Actinobacteria bacterium]|nr:TIR domain-containing protein [Actinomycetota bacterium]
MRPTGRHSSASPRRPSRGSTRSGGPPGESGPGPRDGTPEALSQDRRPETIRLRCSTNLETHVIDGRYELFISYSRKDDANGWVTGLRDQILTDHRRLASDPMRIFLDLEEIRDMDDWRHRVLGALRSSSVLLICQSPDYYRSPHCKWEFEEYLRRKVPVRLGGDPIAVVYFVEVPGTDPDLDERWRDEVTRHQHTDLAPWFPAGARALQDAEVAARIARLGDQLWERVGRARRAETVRGNVRRPSTTFVGRHEELRRVHEQVALSEVGAVTVLHGLGGLGKTELSVAYAHVFADHYRGGAWTVSAEGRTDLLALIGELANAPELHYVRTEAEQADPRLAGRGVLEQLVQSATAPDPVDSWTSGGRHALLILDNVDKAALLSKRQLAELPAGDAVRVLVTTRLGPNQLRNRTTMTFVPIDSLAPDDALELIRSHQPPRDPEGGRPDFTSPAEEAAARMIVKLLGGFTVAVEQVAVHLGLNPDVSPSRYLAQLQREGLAVPDPNSATGVREEMHHDGLAVVLDSTMAGLDPPSQFVMCAASLLPPDGVPWPWLRDLAVAAFPHLAADDDAGPDPWLRVRRTLEGLRLLTPADSPEIACIHRLVAAHLRRADASSIASDAVASHLVDRGWEISAGRIAGAWECTAFTHAALALLDEFPEITRPARHAVSNLARYVTDSSVRTLAERLLDRARGEAAARPGDPDAVRGLAVALDKLGNVLRRIDPDAALGLYAEALEIAREFHAFTNESPWAAKDLAVSLDKTGSLLRRSDPAAALALHEECLAISRSLADSNPGDPQAARDLSIALIKVGDLTRHADAVGALTLYEEALDLARTIARAELGSHEADRHLSVALNKTGSVMRQFDAESAAELYGESLALSRRLALARPGSREAERDLSIALDRVASVSIDPVEALALLRESLAIRRKLVESMPHDLEAARDLSVSLDLVANAIRDDDPGAASALDREAQSIRQRLASALPAPPRPQQDRGRRGPSPSPYGGLSNDVFLTRPPAFMEPRPRLPERAPQPAERSSSAPTAEQLSLAANLIGTASRADAQDASDSSATGTIESLWSGACSILRDLDERGQLPPSMQPLLDLALEKAGH